MTSQINHHLSDDLILAYSAGALPEAIDLIVATHISICDECRARLDAQDAVGGVLLGQSEAVELSPSCLDGALNLIRTTPMEAPKPARRADPVLPDPLRAYVGDSLSDVKWRSLGMGVKQSVLKTSGDATARLLYIPAGTAMPDHGHRGMELTMVLQGAFSDEDGRFARGDIEIAHEDLHHTPVADVSEDCICLAVTDAPLRFKGLLPRLAQPFFGI